MYPKVGNWVHIVFVRSRKWLSDYAEGDGGDEADEDCADEYPKECLFHLAVGF